MDIVSKLNRRGFIKLSAVGLASLGLPAAMAQPADDLNQYDFLIARVKFRCNVDVGDKWNILPGSEKNLLQEFSKIVRCKVKLSPDCQDWKPKDGHPSFFNAVVDLNDLESMNQYPFLLMTASGSYKLTIQEKLNIAHYLRQGGFLFMDDCIHEMKDYFFRSSVLMLEETFGPGSVKKVPLDHEIFMNVYDLTETGLPFFGWGVNHGAHGIFIDDRLAVFLSPSDLHCAWCDRSRQIFGTQATREKATYREAIQMGVNVLMYAISH